MRLSYSKGSNLSNLNITGRIMHGLQGGSSGYVAILERNPSQAKWGRRGVESGLCGLRVRSMCGYYVPSVITVVSDSLSVKNTISQKKEHVYVL